MGGTHGRPDEAVHNFLGHPVPRRSTRTFADHLAPPRRPAPVPPARTEPRPAPAPAPPPRVPPAARPVAPPPEAVVGQARASERRTVLDDERPSLTVPAAERGSGSLRFSLQWEQQVTSTGLHRSSDVHLGCFWETRDRHSGALQSLGALLAAPGFGARQVLRLGARSEQAGEEVLADAAHLDLLRRMVFYVYAQGPAAPDYAALAPRLTISRRGAGTVQVWAQDPPAGARTCALASIHDVAGDLVLRRENEFFTGTAREVALAYGFDDLDWNAEGTVPRPS
ncbi:hypothetical protein ACFEMC_07265 [Kineococcus sp. DHX-1]|uniref:hypothetical protein n=1 Tax=Kineococcus sp. DHX-1 TaxID=3349638 RepID=UPI0036D24455